jgi:hypothetical protein
MVQFANDRVFLSLSVRELIRKWQNAYQLPKGRMVAVGKKTNESLSVSARQPGTARCGVASQRPCVKVSGGGEI